MKKYLSFLLTAIFLMLFLGSIICFADGPIWIMSDDAKTLTKGQTVFTLYEKSPEIDFLPENEIKLYRIADETDDDLYRYEYVAQISEDIAYMYNTGDLFVTEEGRRQFDSFVNGEYSYYLYHVEYNGVVDFDFQNFKSFIDEKNMTEIDVTTLWNDDVFYVRGYDKTGCFAHKCGAVYRLDDGYYYYIHYDALDNTYFDAYGDFSYRKGMVSAYKLTGENEKFVSDAKYTSKVRTESYIYPDEKTFVNDEDSVKALTTFILVPLIFGFIIPIVPFVLSIVFAKSKKAVNPKRWCLLTAYSAMWILTSAVIMFLFIF